MRFKTFLLEQATTTRHALTYQKLLMALDDAHVTKNDNYYEFNLGSVVKDSTLKGLTVRIQAGEMPSVKLGKHRDGRMILVIEVNELPGRLDIDQMFSSNKSLMNNFIKNVTEFYDKYRTDSPEGSELTKQEKTENLDSKESFEESYDKLISAIDKKMEEFKLAVKDLEQKEQSTVNAMKKAALQSAKNNVKKDIIGNTEKEFVKMMLKLPEADFVALLDKEISKKVIKRLENYYDQKI